MRTVGYVGPRETKCLRTNRRRFRRGKSTNGPHFPSFDPNTSPGWKSFRTRGLSIPIQRILDTPRMADRPGGKEEGGDGAEIFVRFHRHRLAESRQRFHASRSGRSGIINANQSCETRRSDSYEKKIARSLCLCLPSLSHFFFFLPWRIPPCEVRVDVLTKKIQRRGD